MSDGIGTRGRLLVSPPRLAKKDVAAKLLLLLLLLFCSDYLTEEPAEVANADEIMLPHPMKATEGKPWQEAIRQRNDGGDVRESRCCEM